MAERAVHGVTRSGDVPAPDVSVVITCYNYARYLGAAVASVRDQPGVELEIIIVDDVSTDDSLAVAQRLAAADPRITVVAREVNGGPVEAFNQGLDLVRGRAWVRLDADDLLTPGALQRGLDVLDPHPTVGLVYGRPLFFRDGSDRPRPATSGRTVSVWHGMDWLRSRCLSGRPVISSVEVMVRTAATDEVGGMAPLSHTHDFELWNRVAARWEVAHLDRVHQGYHRIHPASMTQTQVTAMTDVFDRADGFAALFASGMVTADEAGYLDRRARRALALEALRLAIHAWDRRRGTIEDLRSACGFAAAVYPPIRSHHVYRAAERRVVYRRRTLAIEAMSLVGSLGRRGLQEARLASLRRFGVDDLHTLARRRRLPVPPVSESE